MTDYKKKLIEVAIPLEAINAASAPETSIRHRQATRLHARVAITLSVFALSFNSLSASAATRTPPPPDLLIVNAKVFTADPAHPWAQAVAIKGKLIEAVGDSKTIRRSAGPATRVIDAGGRLLTPGLTAAHEHVPGLAPIGSPVQFPARPGLPDPTPDEILHGVATAPPGDGWLVGAIGERAISDAIDGKHNWRKALDAVAPNRPVLLTTWWAHGALFNSAALARLGIADNAPNPTGGFLGHDAESKLSGWSLDAGTVLFDFRMRKRGMLSPETANTRQIAQAYLHWGVTSVGVMGGPVDMLIAMLGKDDSPLEWNVYAWQDPEEPAGRNWDEAARAHPPKPNIRVVGVKYVLDATPIERFAFQREDYLDRPGWHGVSDYSDHDLQVILRGALEGPGQTALHIVGDGEMQRVLDAMEAMAPPARWRSRRVRIEHGDGVRPNMIARVRRLGMMVVGSPYLHDQNHPDENGKMFLEARFKPARAAHYILAKSLLDGGVLYSPAALDGIGDDSSNPFVGMQQMIADHDDPSESLTRKQALSGFTSGGALALHEEHRRGVIRPGMAANLALLSQDVLTVPLDKLPSTTSVLTIIDGAIAYRDPTFVGAH